MVKRKGCLLIRYGGIGDCVQISSVLPGLKKKWGRVTVNTTPRGREILKTDPHIDDFIIQDTDQVPNHELEAYWKAWDAEFEGPTINLCESIEGALLAIPGRRNHAMSQAARHRMMNINYLEWLHLLADVPFEPAAKFYPTEQETAAMRALVGRIKKPVVVWALAGSSVHKAWPWVDHAMPALLESGVAVIMIGGEECRLLEAGVMQTLVLNNFGVSYEDSNEMSESAMVRKINAKFGPNALKPMSGKLDIRKSLTLAGMADVVVGPETGILNAVGLDPDVHKVVMLSHSSAENLTKHWVNETVIEPGVACFPCHRMQYDSTYCPRDEATGASICAASIDSASVVSAIMRGLTPHMRKTG